MAHDVQMDQAQIEELVAYLHRWAGGTENDRPFLVMMGRTLTPDEFVDEVENGTSFGNAFLRYVAEQARRSHVRPLDLVYQAIVADRVR
jgi:hypothetical protein